MALLQKLLLAISIIIILMAYVTSSPQLEPGHPDQDSNPETGKDESASDELPSLGLRRFLTRYEARTCDKHPAVCRVKGSSGPDCCRKKCVNVKTDRLNCGKCGARCRFTETCCKAKCINLAFDRNNCGRCGKKCLRGSLCIYGMCGYA